MHALAFHASGHVLPVRGASKPEMLRRFSRTLLSIPQSRLHCWFTR